MRTKIIYEDAHVLVCHKPAGLATQSGRVGQEDMVSELKKYLVAAQKSALQQGRFVSGDTKGAGAKGGKVGEPYLGVIHRLDQPVEGLLVFAKNSSAAANLTTQLSKGSLNKQYYALLCGKPCAKVGEIVDYLVKEKDVARVSKKDASEAKKAVLQYEIMKEMTTQSSEIISLADIHIDTGRFHQIRVQMAHAGCPLLGDSKYGNKHSVAISKELGIRNVALYAYKVEFLHPVTGKKLEFTIEPKLPGGFGNIN